MNLKRILLAFFVALVTACSGGGSTGTDSGSLSLYVTDNLTQDYSEVWVTIHSVTTTDSANQTVVLFEDASGTGHVQNLRELVDIGSLLNVQNLAEGAYTGFAVTLSNQVNLVDATGTTTNALLDNALAADTLYTTDVPGSVNVSAGKNIAIALDFDLAQFTYDDVTNTVMPVVVYKSPQQTDSLLRTFAEIEGRVVAIADDRSFTLAPEHRGSNIQVILHDDAVVYLEHSMGALNDTGLMRIGRKVEAYGNFSADTLTLEAIRVKVENEGDGNKLQDAEGTVISYDGSSGILEINVHDADFMPVRDTLTVDVSGAVFTRGSADLLAAGMRVELKGAWDKVGQTFSVAAVEIEGAPRQGDLGHTDNYAEIHGTVNGIDGNIVSMTITGAEHTSLMAGETVSVDIANAWFKEGSASCLAAGAQIEAKGAIDTGIAATLIEVKQGCGHGDTGHDQDDNNDDGDRPHVYGTVISVDGDAAVLEVSRYEHFPSNSTPAIGDRINIT